MLGMPWIKCTEDAYKKCPFSTTCGDVENAIFMEGSDCDKFNQSIKRTTVDAVPVVRCRDCTSFEEIGMYPAGMPEYPDEMPYGYCYHWDYEQGMSPNQVDGNDFCSYGKRKVDENGRT